MPSTPPSAEAKEDSGPTPQEESDHAQEEFDEVNTARQRPNDASGRGTTFTGLSGTVRWGAMRAFPSTDEAATRPSLSQPPKTFTPNPTPLKASSADLPNPPSGIQPTTASSYTPREFHLVIERSFMNHHLYIQRQHYYAGFTLDLKGAMGDDLEGRVPVAGMADCQLGKPEVPLRIRMKQREKNDNMGWTSLGSLWEEGERARERKAAGEVGVDDGVREFAPLT